jgi:hypothetical protein
MRISFLILIFAINVPIFGQSEILDSIDYVRSLNKPELGKSLCTEGFWNGVQENGALVFRQICEMKPNFSFKEVGKKQNGKFCVLEVDFLVDDVPKDLIYLYLKEESGKWLLDGMNETEVQIKYFLNGSYSGHFSPLELSPDAEFNEFGKKIVTFGLDKEKLLAFLKLNATDGVISEKERKEMAELFEGIDPEFEETEPQFDFVNQLTNPKLGGHIVLNTGYDEKNNLGFIHFESKIEYLEDLKSSTTLFLSKEKGNMRILGCSYSPPFASDFLYNIGR